MHKELTLRTGSDIWAEAKAPAVKGLQKGTSLLMESTEIQIKDTPFAKIYQEPTLEGFNVKQTTHS